MRQLTLATAYTSGASAVETRATCSSSLHTSSSACALPHRPIEHPNILRLAGPRQAGPFGLPALVQRRRVRGVTPTATPRHLAPPRPSSPAWTRMLVGRHSYNSSET